MPQYTTPRASPSRTRLTLNGSLLLDEAFVDLRNCIYTYPAEYHHFRRLIVNLVMATDIMDKSLSRARKERWWKVFAEDSGSNLLEDTGQRINRRATIDLEHVIQASDVSHTMQHWHMYRRWNVSTTATGMKDKLISLVSSRGGKRSIRSP